MELDLVICRCSFSTPSLFLDPASHSTLSLAISCSNHALVKHRKLQKKKKKSQILYKTCSLYLNRKLITVALLPLGNFRNFSLKDIACYNPLDAETV